MTLCDIGNTTFDFYNDSVRSKIAVDECNVKEYEDEIFYICVNAKVAKELESLENWINLKQYVDMKNYYSTMGIDRIAGCEAVTNGVIVDVGSAITVDVVREGKFAGGYIALGLSSAHNAYVQISSALDYSFNFEIDLDKMPKNSQDAITYGQLGLLYRDVMSYALPVFLTGGDAQKLRPLFKDASLDEELLFKGMINIMKKADLC